MNRLTAEMMRLQQVGNRCGLAYGKLGRFVDAEKSFIFALNNPYMAASAHTNLANMYLRLERRIDAQEHFELAIDSERNPALRAYRKSHMLMKLHPSDRARLLEAKTHLEQAVQLQPQLVPVRQALQRLNKILGAK